VTVDDIIPQRAQDALTQAHQRLIRLATLDSARMTDALTWLSGYSPSTFDATLNATEPCTDDDTPDLAEDPEPFCTVCGANLGIFLRFGLDWRHYRSDGTTAGPIELFDPGHAPVIAWRPTPAPTDPTLRYPPRQEYDWARTLTRPGAPRPWCLRAPATVVSTCQALLSLTVTAWSRPMAQVLLLPCQKLPINHHCGVLEAYLRYVLG
jgi:hypothetical protein